jgi:hypothetical protein
MKPWLSFCQCPRSESVLDSGFRVASIVRSRLFFSLLRVLHLPFRLTTDADRTTTTTPDTFLEGKMQENGPRSSPVIVITGTPGTGELVPSVILEISPSPLRSDPRPCQWVFLGCILRVTTSRAPPNFFHDPIWSACLSVTTAINVHNLKLTNEGLAHA